MLRFTRFIIIAVMLVFAAYVLVIGTFGTRGAVEVFVALTAIDHWHPNWPGTDAAVAGLRAAYPLAMLVLVFCAITGLLSWVLARTFNTRPSAFGASLSSGSSVAMQAAQAVDTAPKLWSSIRDSVRIALVDGGADDAEAENAVRDAGSGIDQRKPLTPERMRAVLGHAAAATGLDLEGPLFTVVYETRGTDVPAISRVLTDLGYRSVADPTCRSPRRMHVAYRTEDFFFEACRIELLVAAARAHVAAMPARVGGAEVLDAARGRELEGAIRSLQDTARKMYLRGLALPHGDLSRRFGMRGPDDLEAWAVYEVARSQQPPPQMHLDLTPGADTPQPTPYPVPCPPFAAEPPAGVH